MTQESSAPNFVDMKQNVGTGNDRACWKLSLQGWQALMTTQQMFAAVAVEFET